jgi:phage gp36-like protein
MYASVADMVGRYGEAELMRLSAPEGQLSGPIDTTAVETALTDATSRIDSYLSSRYQLPVSPVPPAVVAACCALARFALGLGNNQVPSESSKAERDDTTAWLKRLAEGNAMLPGATLAEDATGARTSDRCGAFVAGQGLRG